MSGEVDIEDLIPEGDCVITLTHLGYIKRQPADTYKTQRRGGRGISGMSQRDEDFVEELFLCSTHDYICSSPTGAVYTGSRAMRSARAAVPVLVPILSTSSSWRRARRSLP